MSDSDKPSEDEEPKLVVDTDWKEQVAREKEAAESAATQTDDEVTAPESPPDSGGEPSQDSEPAATESVATEPDEMPEPPPATFEMLISMMFTQAMAMLGQMPDPSTGQINVNKPFAKHYIDTLEMLGEKTAGNLDDNEKKMLSEALHALRMMYVNAKAP